MSLKWDAETIVLPFGGTCPLYYHLLVCHKDLYDSFNFAQQYLPLPFLYGRQQAQKKAVCLSRLGVTGVFRSAGVNRYLIACLDHFKKCQRI